MTGVRDGAKETSWRQRAALVCAQGFDPMAKHHDCCGCRKCDIVRLLWWEFNEKEIEAVRVRQPAS